MKSFNLQGNFEQKVLLPTNQSAANQMERRNYTLKGTQSPFWKLKLHFAFRSGKITRSSLDVVVWLEVQKLPRQGAPCDVGLVTLAQKLPSFPPACMALKLHAPWL